ncbi:uncharacterized protein LOC117111709 isoform X2 [Anneissia japonica]|uniref:uncharacterized protein LOC117111709 isoform X2 n=1 Tax=Anneissia japonica TaxID=1529436 RepID=UPI00142567A0|nr:uncharacterized protein LOC117111709 isoform X2 [Anneissia japonica]
MTRRRTLSLCFRHGGKRVRKLSDSENDSLRSSFRIETGNSQFYTKVPLTHLEIDNAGTGLTRNKRTQASFRLKKMTGRGNCCKSLCTVFCSQRKREKSHSVNLIVGKCQVTDAHCSHLNPGIYNQDRHLGSRMCRVNNQLSKEIKMSKKKFLIT